MVCSLRWRGFGVRPPKEQISIVAGILFSRNHYSIALTAGALLQSRYALNILYAFGLLVDVLLSRIMGL